MWLGVELRHQKDMWTKEIRLRAQNMSIVQGSIVNT